MSTDLLTEYAIQNVTLAGSTTDITGGTFPASGTFTGVGTLRISVCIDTATTIGIRATPTGGSATTFPLLNNVALTVNSPVSFILKVPTGMTFTFRAGAGCVVQWMTVEAVTGGIF